MIRKGEQDARVGDALDQAESELSRVCRQLTQATYYAVDPGASATEDRPA